MSLVVLQPGLATRIVDQGRSGSRHLGVPVGGAAGRRALLLGNALLGNAPHAAALEITLQGPSLKAEADLACVLFGAPFTSHYEGASSESIEAGHSFRMAAGSRLHVGTTSRGMRAYLCVSGGLQTALILGSRSGLANIRKGDMLACRPDRQPRRFCPAAQPVVREAWTVRTVPGLQADWFDTAEFYGQDFLVTPASDRMGLRLEGQALKLPERELVSEPIAAGAVQVTRDGKCIVLGVDGQTIGGYPKIAHVIQADLDALGQVRPGQRLRFARISLPQALPINRAAREEARLWALRLRLSLDGFPVDRRLA